MKHIREYEEKELNDLIGDLQKIGQVEEWQVVFHDYDNDDIPYTLETWSSKGEAEK
jgi:hypothetical protein